MWFIFSLAFVVGAQEPKIFKTVKDLVTILNHSIRGCEHKVNWRKSNAYSSVVITVGILGAAKCRVGTTNRTQPQPQR